MKLPLTLSSAFILLASLVTFAPAAPTAVAQGMHETKPSTPSSYLELSAQSGTKLRLTPAELKALPHQSVTVLNGHSKQNETYSGVAVADLLSRVDVPLGAKLRGKLLLGSMIATGTDGYAVLYSLAEVDPASHTGDVIVADSMNGAPLGSDGAFKLVSTEDKRPARWVRNLQSLAVLAGDTH